MQLQKSEREQNNARSSRFFEKIGSTMYRVSVNFPNTETETLDEKIRRLIRNDLTFPAQSSIIGVLQTGRLSERGAV